MSSKSRSFLVAALVLAVALPAQSEVFTVTLTNGAEFDTRYRPVQSSTDEAKIQLLTETGNWITLDKSIVVSIVAETESKGFGMVIDTQTIALGWDPTSMAESEEGQEEVDPTTQLLNYLIEQDRSQSAAPAPPPFSNRQFVEPAEAGGIPLWMSNQVTPPIGGTRQ